MYVLMGLKDLETVEPILAPDFEDRLLGGLGASFFKEKEWIPV